MILWKDPVQKIPIINLSAFKNWSDYNLVWNPEEYGNITTLRILSNKIWIPGKNKFEIIYN